MRQWEKIPYRFLFTLLLGLAFFSASVNAAPRLAVKRSAADVLVGTRITIYAEVEPQEDSGAIFWYQFRLRAPGESSFLTIKDFSPVGQLVWAAGPTEGVYELQVTARDTGSGDMQTYVSTLNVESRVTGAPVVSATANPLVYLYSAPACGVGSTLFVTFASTSGNETSTPLAPCGSRTTNIYLAGLLPQTEYTARHKLVRADGTTELGAEVTFTTAALPFEPATSAVSSSSAAQTSGIVFHNRLFQPSIATDLDGKVLWYYPDPLPYLVGPQKDGTFLALIEDQFGRDEDQLLRLIDLAGNTVWETNAATVNAQLDALGKSRMTSFHHDARILPSGNILVLAANERILTDVQGPGDVDVLGDMIIELDRDFRVVWVWDAFDHLDPARKAVLDEKCVVGGGGCPTFHLAATSNDWLHGNSISVTPDGAILYSTRHQDWIVKIDYGSGSGSGNVIWRLGKDGDFTLHALSDDSWFSHQHDASVSPVVEGEAILLFDNGNTRWVKDRNVTSRGQLIRVDESTHTAELLLNVDLGAYALALGSAATLPNGHFLFGLGWTPEGGSHTSEFDMDGRLIWRLDSATQTYRSVRSDTMYGR